MVTEHSQRATRSASAGETRRAEVDAAIERAAAAMSGDATGGGGAVHAALTNLRARLGRAHDMCDRADDEAWEDYVVGLDRGLGELQIELTRAAERPESTPTLDDVLFTRTNRLELDGWLIRLDIQAKGSRENAEAGRQLADAASREVSAFGTACRVTAGPSRAGVETAMAKLRRAAESGTGPDQTG